MCDVCVYVLPSRCCSLLGRGSSLVPFSHCRALSLIFSLPFSLSLILAVTVWERAFTRILFSESQVRTHLGGLPKTLRKKCFVLFGSNYTEVSFRRSSKNLLFFWWSGGRRAGGKEEEEEDTTGLTMFAVCQSSVLCVVTRPTARNIVWKPLL